MNKDRSVAVAVIGLIGVVLAAVIANYHPSTSGSTSIPNTSISSGSPNSSNRQAIPNKQVIPEKPMTGGGRRSH